MKYCLTSFLSVIFCFLHAALTFAEDGPAADVAQLKPLNHYAGSWNSRIQSPQERNGTTTAKWILEGRFLQQSWTLEPDGDMPALSGTTLMTYDVDLETYRSWSFISNGSLSEGTGVWNGEDHAFTWSARDKNGITTKTRADFSTKDTEKWSIAVLDGDGNLLVEIEGSNTRKQK